MIVYHSIKDIIEICNSENMEFWEVILKADSFERNVPEEESFRTMAGMFDAMKNADRGYDGNLRSASGMAGGDGAKMQEYNQSGKNICGDFMALVMEKALKTSESNACMKRIVAAPTAGSCGVIPAVFLSYQEKYNVPDDTMIKAMFVAAGIGAVITENAYIAGASGGCQAEIGSSSAMASAGLSYLQGGNAECIANAAALALKNMLGLTCDPVCGLVEVPCIKRNVAGAVNAISSAQLSLAGIISAIRPDEVIDSMRRIGDALPACLKETSQGGLAVTESAMEVAKRLK